MDTVVYNSIFFELNNQLIRLQLSNLDKIKDFVPLVYISDKSCEELKNSTKHILDNNIIEQCAIGNTDFSKWDGKPYIKGCLSLLSKLLNVVDIKDIKELSEQLSSGSFLSFLLFSYSFEYCLKRVNGKGKVSDIKSAISFYQKIDECATGILQLIENIVFHAASQTGVLSIRFHSRKTEYVKKHYMGDLKNVPYLEILVTDYSDGLKTENIADNFINNIKNIDLKKIFCFLKPVHFIENDMKDMYEKKVVHAFETYYSYSDNIGSFLYNTNMRQAKKGG